MKPQAKATLLALIAILLWSTVATAFKIALNEISVLLTLFYVSLFSTVFLFVIIVFQNRTSEILNFNRNQVFSSAVLGFLNPFSYYIILFAAYSMLPAQLAQPLNYTWPVMLVLLSIPILKQKISKLGFIAILISFFGVVFISLKDSFSFKLDNPFGVFLAIISSVFWALFWIYNLKDKRDEVVKLFFNFLFGFIFISILVLATSEFKMLSLNGLLAVLYISLFETSITFVLWLKALKLSTSSEKISNLVFISPFISLIFIHFILGEKIYITTFIGLTLIIIGILFQQYLSFRNRKQINQSIY
ncbi:MAG: hypothetical protein A2033_05725 [Bacteroidetes bacterium GWA2_31_9]|nr:MAG: hypothetical protein A2033_05725 [Bacteroidetes bacterium GWA2_31_9]